MNRPVYKTIIFCALVLLVGFCVVTIISDQSRQRTVLERFKPVKYVDLDDSAAVASLSPSSAPELRIAIAPIFSPDRSVRLYAELVRHIGSQLDMKPVMEQRRTYAEINELIRDGGCQIGLVCTFPFIRGEMDFGMELLAVPQFNGKTTYNALVIVPQSSRAESLLDLRGMRFASADFFSSTGWLFPANWLASRGENPKGFFASHVITGSHSGSIEAVVNQDADGASVHSIVFDQMASEDTMLEGQIRILHRSPEYGAPPVVTHPKLDAALKKRIRTVLLTMHETDEGKNALARARIDRFVKPESALYQSVRETAAAYECLR